MRFNYIVTVHDKEDLIARVVGGLLYCAGNDSHVYLVLDGCTDGTERVVDSMIRDCIGVPITKIHAPDVHEIMSLNLALRQAPQDGEGYNILVQDDVILGDWNFEERVVAVNRHYGDRIGVLSFRHGVNVVADMEARDIREVDVIETAYGQGLCAEPLMPGYAAERMVSLRSPECLSFETVRRIGLLNERFAPYMYDDHDYGLRCLRAGLVNVVYCVKTVSRVDWGGMRRKPQPGAVRIMDRNRRYIFEENSDFIRSLSRPEYCKPAVRITTPFAEEKDQDALGRYRENRELMAAYQRRRRFALVTRLREKLGV